MVPGKNGGYDPYGHAWAASWWVPDAWIETGGHPAFDWGIIRLNDGSLGRTVGRFTLAILSTTTLSQPEAYPAVVGYPGDKYPEATMWGSIEPAFATVGETLLFYQNDTAPGMSGSAVWLANTDRPELLGFIIGVHTPGLAQLAGANAGLRMDPFLVSDLSEGSRQMGCSFEHFIENGHTPTPTLSVSPTAATPPGATPNPRPFRLTTQQVSRD